MIHLFDVTLICVTSIKIKESIQSLLHCANLINFKEVKFVTHEDINIQSVKVEKCRNLTSIEAYSHYMIYDLYKHINTEFCLTVQHDGFIINPQLWNDNYLKYDYIGAPWKIRNDCYLDPNGKHIRVGNGGFSLRSQKLLNTPNREHIPFASTMHGDYYKHLNHFSKNEDNIICVHNHELYEKYGNVFAPFEVALTFSKETILPENENLNTFGVHGYKLNDFINLFHEKT
jgi:hypothetical protein